MARYVILDNIDFLIQEVDLLKQLKNIPDTKSLSSLLSNTIASWLRNHPNSKLTDILINAPPPTG